MTRAASVLARYLLQPALALTLAGIIPAVAAQSEPESGPEASPAAHLARMAQAVDGLTYEGTLVYLADNRMETLHIVHRVAGGEVEERLVSLSGPVRAVTRDHDKVTCVLSEDHPILVKRKAGIPDLLRTRAIDPAMLAANYFVHPLGETRVAGRDTDVVGVIPRDDFRYGYRFYLDRQTGLPLKSDLMGTKGDPIEQIMFAAVQVDSAGAGPAATGARPAQPVPEGDLSLTAATAGGAQPAGQTASAWRVEALPPGFAIRMHDRWPEGAGGQAEHLVVTDHLASVSIFVEGEGQGGLTGASRIGAVHAVGGRIAGHQVTVVGQVPAETVAAVLAGLRHDREDAR
jgi:sigma-E factor negative regulatory protein RseB